MDTGGSGSNQPSGRSDDDINGKSRNGAGPGANHARSLIPYADRWHPLPRPCVDIR
jgi:hypothetical protein